MSKLIIKSIVENHPFSDHILFNNGKYIALGNDAYNDFVKIGSASKVKGKSVYRDGQIQDAAYVDDLYQKIHSLYDPMLLGSLRIQSFQIKFIQKTIKLFNATHLKFYGNEQGIFVNFIDILRSIPEARMNRKHETRLLYHQLKKQPSSAFEMNFNAGSFNLLPAKSLHIGFGNNKIGIFTDDESGEVYLMRDPEIIQPVINTFSDLLQQDISFVFPAKSNLQSGHTNPPENLESELDSEDL